MPRRGEIRERRLVGVNVTEHKEQLCERRSRFAKAKRFALRK